jgi:hypothetical protein
MNCRNGGRVVNSFKFKSGGEKRLEHIDKRISVDFDTRGMTSSLIRTGYTANR